jgi:hypothetical protein
MNKKADGKMFFYVIELVLAVVLLLVLFIIFVNKSSSGVQSYETVEIKNAIESCKVAATDKADLDSDGIVDFCDTCVVEMTPEAIAKFQPKDGKALGSSANIVTNDGDGDGIYKGCDSNDGKAASKFLGMIGNPIKSQCNAVAKNGLESKPVERAGYWQCHLYDPSK